MVDTLGGLPPPRGDHANETLTHPADVLPSKIKSFYTDELRQNMDIFPADVFPIKHVHNSPDGRRHLKYLQVFASFWKNYMITR